jgi:hypothetical protein
MADPAPGARQRRFAGPLRPFVQGSLRLRAGGVEFTQEPVDRYGAVDAGFRDPSGNGWKMIEARRRTSRLTPRS